MAKRPVFFSNNEGYRSEMIEFEFFSGFSASQKQKSISSLHECTLEKYPKLKILEISSRSPSKVGIKASAFNLMVQMISGKKYSVEQIFQGSKVFNENGCQIGLLERYDSKTMKKIVKTIHRSDKLIGFNSFGQKFPLEPKTYFYNWLYVNALHKNYVLSKKIMKYNAFSDIEFNPKKSVNCQAEACAIYVFLKSSNHLEEALSNKEKFLKIVYPNFLSKINEEVFSSDNNLQLSLFDS
ncbi:DarT1-associated NADAR antitoxin family protein [Streptococcus hyointestinalis]|uniref:DarT1-associated NADAR antitoxin family protein n=1 Tax=Streptococcus hyointestinalis TaxID=1337 RepID=UPI0013DF9CBD|nr:hypothetical protein [Streptococcus hyointestinalis]